MFLSMISCLGTIPNISMVVMLTPLLWIKTIEHDWEFRSVGTRFLFEYEEGLSNFVLKYLELLAYVRGDASAN